MTPTFSQADLYEMVDGNVRQKFSQVNDRQVTVNRAVRYVLGDVDLRSAKRSAQLSPNLFNDVYEYTAPSDLKGEKLIDIRRQVNRSSYEKFQLVDDIEFDRKKGFDLYRVAIRDENFSKLLRVDGVEGDKKATLHECNSTSSNGTVAASADASNLTVDSDNYISGGSSLNFDMAAGATTGVITFTDITDVDLSDYQDKGSVFIWVFIPDYSDAEGDTVTNFILRVGNDASNYVSRTITTNNEGATFYDGWNLLRFDLNGATASAGTVDWAAIDYLVLTVTKSSSLAADTDWRIDSIVARIGDVYTVVYYTKYGWQNSSGAYIEESSATTDLVVADTEEIEGIAFKASEFASQELREFEDAKYFNAMYMNWKAKYESNNPSEAMKKRRDYGMLPRFQRN
jgi:hypothetical protein